MNFALSEFCNLLFGVATQMCVSMWLYQLVAKRLEVQCPLISLVSRNCTHSSVIFLSIGIIYSLTVRRVVSQQTCDSSWRPVTADVGRGQRRVTRWQSAHTEDHHTRPVTSAVIGRWSGGGGETSHHQEEPQKEASPPEGSYSFLIFEMWEFECEHFTTDNFTIQFCYKCL